MPSLDRSPAPGLKRSLSLVDLTAIGLNATVGSGIFLLPDDLFREMGPWSPLAFGLCVLGLLPVAWCFADAAKRTEATGGPYEYARQEFGETTGYGVGWMCFANSAFSFAAVASAAAAYAGRLVPSLGEGWGPRAFAIFAIFAFGLLNYVGAKPGAWAIRLFTFGKFAVLLLLISVLIPETDLARTSVVESRALTLGGISSAVFIALFALQGFEVVGVPAGEAQSPERKVPLAVLGTLITTGILYVIVQTVLVFGFDEMSVESDAPLADAALALSPSLGVVVAVGALISTLGFVSGSALGTPRYLFAMASHGHLPVTLSRLHPLFRTPHLAILVTSTVAAALVLPLDYRTLIGMSNVAVAVQYGATSLAVFKRGARERSQSQWTKRIALSMLGVVVSIAICFAASAKELLFSVAALLFGLVLRMSVTRRIGDGPPRSN